MHLRPHLSIATGLLCLLAGCASAPVETADDASGGDLGQASPTAPSATPSETRTPPAASEAPSPSAKQKPEPAIAVPEILKFRATTASGDRLDGASLAGRPTLFWFWAPWCPQCRGQIPQVQQIAKTYDGEVNVVGIGSLDDAAAIREFAGDVDQVTHLVDENGSLWRRFKVVEQSSFVLVDTKGKEILRSGYGDSPDLAADIDALVG